MRWPKLVPPGSPRWAKMFGRNPTNLELIEAFDDELREMSEAKAHRRQPSKARAWVIVQWREIKNSGDQKPKQTLRRRFEKRFGKSRDPQARASMERNLRRWVAEAEGRNPKRRTKKRTKKRT